MDQLLGLTPLEGETYVPERTGTRDFWNQKREYLLRTRKGYYNEDYVEFLIKKVWKLRIAKQSGACAFYRKEVEH